jgi:predicted TIM-barrel enzyme
MLTNKSLLYGLGIGLIIGASLLQLMNVAKPSAVKTDLMKGATISEMDRVQLKEAASKYFQVFDNDQKMLSQTQVDALVLQKVKEEKDKQPAEQPPAPVKEVVKETYIFVSSGLNAGNVGDLLVTSGVITDRKAFEDMMYQQQLNEKIVSGVHVFKGPMELARVVSNITTRP